MEDQFRTKKPDSMSAECKKLRGPNDTGPDCGCRGDACALGRDAATTLMIEGVECIEAQQELTV